jgi:hypothetical protein
MPVQPRLPMARENSPAERPFRKPRQVLVLLDEVSCFGARDQRFAREFGRIEADHRRDPDRFSTSSC